RRHRVGAKRVRAVEAERACERFPQPGRCGRREDGERSATAGDRGEVREVARADDLAVRARLLELARRRGEVPVLCGARGHSGIVPRPMANLSAIRASIGGHFAAAASVHPSRPATRRCAGRPVRQVAPGRSLSQPEEDTMKLNRFVAVALATVVWAVAIPALAQVMVGGAPMYANKDIVDNAVNSKDHTTLVAAVKAAGLVPTLKGAGPFTVFAPTNMAFSALPAGTVDMLLKPESKPMLTKVLTYHVVPGRLDAAALMAQIKAGNGKAMLKTVEGDTITATARGNMVILTDMKG